MSKKKKLSVDEVPVIVLTNDRTKLKADTILMFYKAATLGQLGYMDGKDPDTGEIVPLLVGLEPTENDTQFKVYPLARLINKSTEIIPYLVPDGVGGYFTTNPTIEDSGECLGDLPDPEEKEGPSEEE